MHTSVKYVSFSHKILQQMSHLASLAQFIHSIDRSYDVSSINTMEMVVQSLDDLLDESPKIIAQNIDNLIHSLECMMAQPDSTWLLDRANFFDFLTSVVDKYPKLVNAKNPRGSRMFKLALDIISQISAQTSHEWLNPPDGFNDESQQDVDSLTVNRIKISIDNFAQTIGFQVTLKIFQPLFLEYIQKKQDWRYPYAALIIASQIANETAAVQTLGLIIQWAVQMTEYYHPQVKYASLQLFGHYSTDLDIEFQQNYFDRLIPVMIKLLQDPVPRIIAHTFSFMANFFSKQKQLWRIQSIIGQFLNLIIHYIKTGSTWVKQTALTALSYIAEIQDVFGSNLPSIFELCADIFNGSVLKLQYIQILNKSVEIISTLLASQNKANVQQYLSHFINLLFTHKNSLDQDYVLKAWITICGSYQQFTDITQIYGILFQIARDCFKEMDSDEECIDSLKCLKVTLNSFKSKASLYAAQTAAFAKQIYQSAGAQLIKQEALMLEIGTIIATKPSEPQALAQWFSQAFKAYESYIKLIQERLQNKDFLIDQTSFLFEAISELISSFKEFFSGAELISLMNKQFSFVYAIQQAYQEPNDKQAQQDDDDEEIQIQSIQSSAEFDKMISEELEEALKVVPDILQELLMACRQSNTKMEIFRLYEQQIQHLVLKKDPFVRLALSLASDIIQYFAYEQIKAQYPKIIQLLSYYIESPCPKIRNIVVYGLNMLFTKAPDSFFGSCQIQRILQMLSRSFSAPFSFNPKEQKQISEVNHCKDNVVAALGVLLKHFGPTYSAILHRQIYKFWLSNLPLNADLIQGNKQQQFLIEILSNCPGLLISQTKDLLLICEIYAKFVMKRREKQWKQTVEKTKRSMLMMGEWSLFKESAGYLWSSLSESHKQILTQMMTD